jgi:hypothetical protein
MFENTIEIEKDRKNFTHTNRAISMLFLSASTTAQTTSFVIPTTDRRRKNSDIL